MARSDAGVVTMGAHQAAGEGGAVAPDDEVNAVSADSDTSGALEVTVHTPWNERWSVQKGLHGPPQEGSLMW
ncbi:MAG: hypothetical protein AAGI71_09245 [Bacteroidota bacterium]